MFNGYHSKTAKKNYLYCFAENVTKSLLIFYFYLMSFVTPNNPFLKRYIHRAYPNQYWQKNISNDRESRCQIYEREQAMICSHLLTYTINKIGFLS